MWLNKAYQFVVMPNVSEEAMKVFSNIKVFCWLREQGFASVVYVDDTLICCFSYKILG